MTDTATTFSREHTERIELPTPTDDSQRYAHTDFARGQRVNPDPVWVIGDFATGMRTMPAANIVSDFAAGQRTLPATHVVGDFATGMRTLPGQVLVGQFVEAEIEELDLAA